jgi:predicted Zn-dependent protease
MARVEDEGVGPARFAHEEARLVVADPEFLAALAAAAPSLAPRAVAARLGRTLAIALLAAAVGGLVWWGFPRAAVVVAALIPASWEESLGDQVVDGLPGEVCLGEAGQDALDAIVERLTAAHPLPYELDVTVLDVPMVNALAAPGGRIVVFRGLIDAAKSADEVAGVLAHELSHTARRHPTQALVRAMGVSLLFDAALGAGTTRSSAGLAELLVYLQYSRGAENEADRGALELLQAANIDTAPTAAFFERLAAREGSGGGIVAYIGTHPRTAARAQLFAAATPAAPEPALDDEEWAALRAICR